jgi:hypothetical protein
VLAQHAGVLRENVTGRNPAAIYPEIFLYLNLLLFDPTQCVAKKKTCTYAHKKQRLPTKYVLPTNNSNFPLRFSLFSFLFSLFSCEFYFFFGGNLLSIR